MLRYFISREFLLTILGLIGAGVLVYLLIFMLILPAYTRHGKGVTVPDVTYMSAEEAMSTLKEMNLKPEVADSITPSENLIDQSGRWIIRQYPPPFTRVKPGRLIALTVPILNPAPVQLPNIVETDQNRESLSLADAKSRLVNAELRLGKITRRPSESEVVLEARYNGKELKPGDDVPRKALIDLVVGSGRSSSRVQIPDLEGYPYEEALSILNEYGLGVGVLLYNPNGPDDQGGLVYDQNPRPGFADSIRMGESIDLYVYGEEPAATEGIIVEEVKGDNGESQFEQETP